MVEHDTIFITTLISEAVRLGLTRDIKRFSNLVTFTDAKEESIEGIRIPAGDVKLILRLSPVDWAYLSGPMSMGKERVPTVEQQSR